MSACDHTLAHKEGSISNTPEFYNCALRDKGHTVHKDLFNRVAWTVDRSQVPQPTSESKRRVVWSNDVEWRRF